MYMNKFARVQQWYTFTRQWLLYDCKWQDIYDSSNIISSVLKGQFKPIYDSSKKVDCGDIVVAINSKELSLPIGEWRWRMFSHHSQYAKGQTWGVAYDMHIKDPTILLYKGVYKAISNVPLRRTYMARLYIFPDDNIPQHIKENINDQIRGVNRIYQKASELKIKIPSLIDYPENYTKKKIERNLD